MEEGRNKGVTLIIRTATSQNLDAVADLLKKADLPAGDLPDVFGESFAIAVEDDSIVGAAGIECHGDVGLLRSVAVRADQRGKGVAEALTRNRIEWARSRGISELILLTTSASEYFPRLGFKKISRDSVPQEIQKTGQFTSLCPSSAIAMRLRLVQDETASPQRPQRPQNDI